jgi:hypothetical protein
MAQIQDSHSHKLKLLYLVLCGDLNNKSQEGKIQALISNIFKQHTNYVNIVGPKMAARVLNTYVTKGTSSDNLNIKLDHLNLVQQNDIDHLIIDDHQLNQINILREPFLPEIEQYYHEIESFNNEEKEDQFNKLENLARSTRLYKNEKILALCGKYVLSNNDYSLLARVLDLVKRLLSTSLEIDGSNDFVSHVRSKYSL